MRRPRVCYAPSMSTLSRLYLVCSNGVAALCLLALGCHQAPSRTEAPAKTPTKGPDAAPALPRLKQPLPLPAARVVDLLYTTNNGGEAEPCG